jgi:hypothetical protein
VRSLTTTAFAWENQDHLALLHALWHALKPGLALPPAPSQGEGRKGGREGGREGSVWSEIGFQGRDPSTDFRGMGIFGLMQMVSFAESRPEKARSLLLESEHPRRWFPWAVTGVNVSRFVFELLTEDAVLEERLVEAWREGGREGGKEGGMQVVNEVYADVWETFGRVWVDTDPENVMAFPPIWSEVQRRERRRWRQRRGDESWRLLLEV